MKNNTLFNRKTKIVATLGPVTNKVEVIEKLLLSGMNVARFNFSHGDFAEHGKRLKNFRLAMKKTGITAAFMQDLGGPKLRLGDFEGGEAIIEEGSSFVITTEKIIGNSKKVSINYPLFPKEIKVGGSILINDGRNKLVVEKIKGQEVYCRVIIGGKIKSRRGVNLPGAYLSVPALTAKDKKDLHFGLKNKADYFALSFVRRAEDVKDLRKILDKAKSKARIIVKIETPEAIENLDEILNLTDAVMVARGDLAIEISPEEVPMAQKMMIAKCNALGKPVITATQVLDSMIKSSMPTRAEISDIANAILDGTDALMLSEETTLGDYPIEAVKWMSKVAERAEKEIIPKWREEMAINDGNIGESVASASVKIADRIDAKFIACFTNFGYNARMISRRRPRQPILVFSPNISTLQKTILSFGTIPILVKSFKNSEVALAHIRDFCFINKIAKKGDKIIIVLGTPFGKDIETNTIKVEVL